jgi:hypothetical protein
MVRVQIQLTAAQHRQLKRRAREQGVSVAAIVRRSIDIELQARSGDLRHDRIGRALAAAGKYTDPDGEQHVARDHDAVLADAFRR